MPVKRLLGSCLAGLLLLAGTAQAATPTLSVSAPASVSNGTPSASATIVGGSTNPGPTGTITFKLYSPDQPSCTGTPVQRSKTVNGAGPYTDSFSMGFGGTYRWVITYSGDANNTAVSTACNAHPVQVSHPPAQITGSATASRPLGQAISATAEHVDGFLGTMRFRLYAPGDTTCSGTPVLNRTVDYDEGPVSSGNYTPTAAGTYRWVASVDAGYGYGPGSTTCGQTGMNSVITGGGPVATTITASAVTAANLGQSVTATATVNGSNPSGNLHFKLYGPGDTTCTGTPVFTQTKSISGAGPHTSNAFTPTSVGTYRWKIDYAGDSSNLASATTCGQAGMSSVISPPPPEPTTIDADVVASAFLGQSVSASATVEGNGPTGDLHFKLYAAGDTTCSGTPVFTQTKSISGQGPHSSNTFVPSAVGTYRWTVAYAGDAANQASSTACGQAGMSSVISPRPAGSTFIEASVTQTAELGATVSATATVDGDEPTGNLTFRLFAAGDETCTGTPVFSQTKSITGEGPHTSDAFTPTGAGTYRWKIDYAGDSDNLASGTTCGQAGLSSVITEAVDPCFADPDLPECEEPDPCEVNPALPGCQEPDPCTVNPMLPQCQVCPPGDSGTWPFCVRPCPPGEVGTPPDCAKPNPCLADPGAAGCQVAEPVARLSVGGAKPRTKKVKRGGTVPVRVTVTNTGEATATGVRACSKVSRKAFRADRKCVGVGSIGAGSSRTATFMIKAGRRAKGGARVTVTITSENAGGGRAVATVRA